jgi:integrase
MSEYRGRLVEQDTKTHRARVVQVPASVLEELREHLDVHVEDRADAPIFTTPTGDRVRLSNWRHRVWQPAATQLEFPSWATPYVLRHTAASLMAQSGVPVTAAAAALGHDPAVFLRTYAHLYPGDLKAVADAMDMARGAARGATNDDTGGGGSARVSRVDFAGMARRANGTENAPTL